MIIFDGNVQMLKGYKMVQRKIIFSKITKCSKSINTKIKYVILFKLSVYFIMFLETQPNHYLWSKNVINILINMSSFQCHTQCTPQMNKTRVFAVHRRTQSRAHTP